MFKVRGINEGDTSGVWEGAGWRLGWGLLSAYLHDIGAFFLMEIEPRVSIEHYGMWNGGLDVCLMKQQLSPIPPNLHCSP